MEDIFPKGDKLIPRQPFHTFLKISKDIIHGQSKGQNISHSSVRSGNVVK